MSTKTITLPNNDVVEIHQPSGYVFQSDGVYERYPSQENKISDLIFVDAFVCQTSDQSIWVRIGYINILNNKFSYHYAPRSMLISDYTNSLVKELVDKGGSYVAGKQKDLLEFLYSQRPHKTILAVEKIGWFSLPSKNKVFVLPEKIIGEPDTEVIYQPETSLPIQNSITASCALDDWVNKWNEEFPHREVV